MSGLENITKTIIDEANAQSKSILEAAQKQADEIIMNAKAQADEKQKAMLTDAETKAKQIRSAADSSIELSEKNELLKAKMQLINDTFDKTVELLVNMPSEDYFVAVKQLISANALNEQGLIVFNSNDLKRIPSGFMSMVESVLKSPAKLEISKEANDIIVGGCILKYGDIEINLGFDRIIEDKKEQLIDKVNAVLFP